MSANYVSSYTNPNATAVPQCFYSNGFGLKGIAENSYNHLHCLGNIAVSNTEFGDFIGVNDWKNHSFHMKEKYHNPNLTYVKISKDIQHVSETEPCKQKHAEKLNSNLEMAQSFQATVCNDHNELSYSKTIKTCNDSGKKYTNKNNMEINLVTKESSGLLKTQDYISNTTSTHTFHADLKATRIKDNEKKIVSRNKKDHKERGKKDLDDINKNVKSINVKENKRYITRKGEVSITINYVPSHQKNDNNMNYEKKLHKDANNLRKPASSEIDVSFLDDIDIDGIVETLREFENKNTFNAVETATSTKLSQIEEVNITSYNKTISDEKIANRNDDASNHSNKHVAWNSVSLNSNKKLNSKTVNKGLPKLRDSKHGTNNGSKNADRSNKFKSKQSEIPRLANNLNSSLRNNLQMRNIEQNIDSNLNNKTLKSIILRPNTLSKTSTSIRQSNILTNKTDPYEFSEKNDKMCSKKCSTKIYSSNISKTQNEQKVTTGFPSEQMYGNENKILPCKVLIRKIGHDNESSRRVQIKNVHTKASDNYNETSLINLNDTSDTQFETALQVRSISTEVPNNEYRNMKRAILIQPLREKSRKRIRPPDSMFKSSISSKRIKESNTTIAPENKNVKSKYTAKFQQTKLHQSIRKYIETNYNKKSRKSTFFRYAPKRAVIPSASIEEKQNSSSTSSDKITQKSKADITTIEKKIKDMPNTSDYMGKIIEYLQSVDGDDSSIQRTKPKNLKTQCNSAESPNSKLIYTNNKELNSNNLKIDDMTKLKNDICKTAKGCNDFNDNPIMYIDEKPNSIKAIDNEQRILQQDNLKRSQPSDSNSHTVLNTPDSPILKSFLNVDDNKRVLVVSDIIQSPILPKIPKPGEPEKLIIRSIDEKTNESVHSTTIDLNQKKEVKRGIGILNSSNTKTTSNGDSIEERQNLSSTSPDKITQKSKADITIIEKKIKDMPNTLDYMEKIIEYLQSVDGDDSLILGTKPKNLKTQCNSAESPNSKLIYTNNKELNSNNLKIDDTTKLKNDICKTADFNDNPIMYIDEKPNSIKAIDKEQRINQQDNLKKPQPSDSNSHTVLNTSDSPILKSFLNVDDNKRVLVVSDIKQSPIFPKIPKPGEPEKLIIKPIDEKTNESVHSTTMDLNQKKELKSGVGISNSINTTITSNGDSIEERQNISSTSPDKITQKSKADITTIEEKIKDMPNTSDYMGKIIEYLQLVDGDDSSIQGTKPENLNTKFISVESTNSKLTYTNNIELNSNKFNIDDKTKLKNDICKSAKECNNFNDNPIFYIDEKPNSMKPIDEEQRILQQDNLKKSQPSDSNSHTVLNTSDSPILKSFINVDDHKRVLVVSDIIQSPIIPKNHKRGESEKFIIKPIDEKTNESVHSTTIDLNQKKEVKRGIRILNSINTKITSNGDLSKNDSVDLSIKHSNAKFGNIEYNNNNNNLNSINRTSNNYYNKEINNKSNTTVAKKNYSKFIDESNTSSNNLCREYTKNKLNNNELNNTTSNFVNKPDTNIDNMYNKNTNAKSNSTKTTSNKLNSISEMIASSNDLCNKDSNTKLKYIETNNDNSNSIKQLFTSSETLFKKDTNKQIDTKEIINCNLITIDKQTISSDTLCEKDTNNKLNNIVINNNSNVIKNPITSRDNICKTNTSNERNNMEANNNTKSIDKPIANSDNSCKKTSKTEQDKIETNNDITINIKSDQQFSANRESNQTNANKYFNKEHVCALCVTHKNPISILNLGVKCNDCSSRGKGLRKQEITDKSETFIKRAMLFTILDDSMFVYFKKKLYSATNLIHQGSFSNIVKCRDSSGHIRVVKIFKKGYLPAACKRLKEIQNTIPDINYYCILFGHDFKTEHYWSVMMEYYPQNLQEILDKNERCFFIDIAQNLSKQLMTACVMLRCNSIIHSDITPRHILLNTENNKLKLCGFDQSIVDTQFKHSNIWKPFHGSLHYRAPEIILGISEETNSGYSVDVWSVACIIYAMVTNCTLFFGHTNNDVLFKQLSLIGDLSQKSIKNAAHGEKYFSNDFFLRRSLGDKEATPTVVKRQPHEISMSVLNAYHKYWAQERNIEQKTTDIEKIKQCNNLISKMLTMEQKNRISIEFAMAHPFIYKYGMF